MLNPFDTIKETLQIADVLTFYGMGFNRNKAFCPLHNEKSPSFTVYPKTKSWHCFGCGAGGSVIDFVMAFYGLDTIDAAKKIDNDFNLGLFENKPSIGRRGCFNRATTQEVLNRLKSQQAEQQAQTQTYKGLTGAFETYMNKAYFTLCDYLHLLEDWKIAYAPKTPKAPKTAKESEGIEQTELIHPLFVEACHQGL